MSLLERREPGAGSLLQDLRIHSHYFPMDVAVSFLMLFSDVERHYLPFNSWETLHFPFHLQATCD